MRAILWDRYGPPEVLRPGQVPIPEPRANEIRIKIHCTTVTAGDCELRAFKPPQPWVAVPLRIALGIFKPRHRVPGMELAGVVDAVGSAVTQYQPGDRVVGGTDIGLGAYAEYICLKENHALGRIPDNVSYEAAVTLPVGGINGLHFMKLANIQSGEHVLINGAGGSIGSYALQIAKQKGATITAVDSGPKLPALAALGANHTMDYTVDSVADSGKRYDVVFDVVGSLPYHKAKHLLTPTGRLVVANPTGSYLLRGATNKRVFVRFATETNEAYEHLLQQLSAGTITPLIDKRVPLEDMVEAHHYVESGQKSGILVVNL